MSTLRFRRTLPPILIAAVALAVLTAGARPVAQIQTLGSRMTVAIGVGSSRESAEALNTRIAEMLTAGELVRRYDAADALAPNRRHEYFSQVHRGVPVEGGGLSRQTVDGETVSVFGTLFTGIAVDVEPRLSAVAVILQASQELTIAPLPGSDTTLVVLPELDGTYRLVYRASFADGRIRFLEADTGAVVRVDDAFSSQGAVGTGLGVHGDNKKVSAARAGGAFEARDQLRPIPIVTRTTQGTTVTFDAIVAGAGTVASDTDNVWVNPAVVDAHANAGWTYDYFHLRHNWLGLDGRSGAFTQVVADRSTIDTNAFFVNPTTSLPLGLVAYGVTAQGVPLTPLDIVGHEMMHGVTFFSLRNRTGQGLASVAFSDGLGPTQAVSGTQNFLCSQAGVTLNGAFAPFFCNGGAYVLFSNHSGAINEGMSDVFGTAVEMYHQPIGNAALRADYTIGEDVAIGGPAGTPVAGLQRSLSDPASQPVEPTGAVRYPDHYNNRLRFTAVVSNNQLFLVSLTIINGRFFTVSTDSGGVHWNATIPGQVFFLAIEGGANRTSGRTVQGVGTANRAQIERVFFRAMNTLMPQSPTFPVFGAVLRQSAVDLFGSAGAEFRAVDQALTAVGL